MSDRSDAELVALARQGDKASFGALAKRYRHTAERVALSMVSNVGVAHELTQEALLAAYLSLNKLREPERFSSWLCGIVRNMCRNYLRASRATLTSLEELPAGFPYQTVISSQQPPDPLAAAEAAELSSTILTAIEQLSDENRIVVYLFYYRGRSVQQIASSLDISAQAVKGRLHKSRKLLRGMLAHLQVQEERRTVRRIKMIRVTVADVVRREEDNQNVVVLVDEAGRRALPIWVGAFESTALSLGVQKYATQRPLTYDFMLRLLDACGGELEAVRIEKLVDQVFMGVAQVRVDGHTRELDARPSDLLALAVRAGCPIFVSAEVMEIAGANIGAQPETQSPSGDGIEAIVGEVAQELAACVTLNDAERHMVIEKIMADVFGS